MNPTRCAIECLQEHVRPTLAYRIIVLQAMFMGSGEATLVEKIGSSWRLDMPNDAHPEHASVAKATTGAVVSTLDDVVLDLDLMRHRASDPPDPTPAVPTW